MTINERIKWFRKEHLRISQAEFAKVIGMKQTSVSTFERIGASVSDQIIKSICIAFSVREPWLRNGEGEMLIEKPDTFSLDQYAKERGASELELALAKAYFDLPKDVRAQMMAKLKSVLGSESEAAEDPLPVLELIRPSTPDLEAEKQADLEREADEFAAIAREQFLSEKRRASQARSAKPSGGPGGAA